jgi:hypothetical protein
MKKSLLCILVFGLVLGGTPGLAQGESSQKAAEIVHKMDRYFQQIKDATLDVTLDYNIRVLGCSGNRHFAGKGYFKHPTRLKAKVNGTTYFANGNQIRRIDEDGKKFYIRLTHSIDMSIGFRPNLMTHNFYLELVEENTEQYVIKGIPKPGTLKSVTEIYFYINKDPLLISALDVKFINQNLGGKLKIDYKKIQGIWVPHNLAGQSAIVLPGGFLVGMDLDLTGSNIRINTGLSEKLFDPGF